MTFQRLAPNVADLQTGDLVWPRADTQLVSFRQQPWELVHAEFTAQSDQLGELQAGQLELFVRDIWVGHVALIEVINGVPWVVDATPDRSGQAQPRTDGVATQTYAEFLRDSARTQSHIWHGRVKPESVAQRERIGERLLSAAKTHLGAEYSINPFGLETADKFYCSKLIWHALRDGLGIKLEKRGLQVPQPWFTPWDLMQADCIRLLYEPAGKSYRG